VHVQIGLVGVEILGTIVVTAIATVALVGGVRVGGRIIVIDPGLSHQAKARSRLSVFMQLSRITFAKLCVYLLSGLR
ncbi:MAG TPA: hypothetical protein VFU05_00685, partial [Cyclobacteriaceae bacterium]|nr:hypothetical protein [Cyclobacteriaceae bacterium]